MPSASAPASTAVGPEDRKEKRTRLEQAPGVDESKEKGREGQNDGRDASSPILPQALMHSDEDNKPRNLGAIPTPLSSAPGPPMLAGALDIKPPASSPPRTIKQPSPSPTKPIIPLSPPRTASIVKDEPGTPPKPVIPPSSMMSPGSSPSSKKKRTPEEINANREAALRIRKEKEQREKREKTQKMWQTQGQQALSKFGFAPQEGVSLYGNGKGGEEILDPNAPREPWAPDPRCSEEQIQVLEEVRRGGNVFFTGSAGVGKSFLLQEIRRVLDYDHRSYQVTASTGIAALQVNGSTLHSWAGVGLGTEPLVELYDKLKAKKIKRQDWCKLQVLIIDEISMVDPNLFVKLNLIGKLIRSNRNAFGGIQLVVSGDFFQIPPVPESRPKCIRCGIEGLKKIKPEESKLPYEEPYEQLVPDPKISRKEVVSFTQAPIFRCEDITVRGVVSQGCGLETRGKRFVFETETWAECDFTVMELTKVFRQSDPEYIALLERFRRGNCLPEDVELLKTFGSALAQQDSIKPTNLYPHRASVDSENQQEFKKLPDRPYVFYCDDQSRGPYGEMVKASRLKDVPGQQEVRLKKGAQVLLLANISVLGGLVNGSRGVVVDFKTVEEAKQEEPPASANPAKGGGQMGSEEWRAKAAADYLEKQKEKVLPVVFWASGGTTIVWPHSWCIDLDKNNTVARTQLPLALGWALTIHKSQGQSLDAVGVKLAQTFEFGQSYVALSRCRTPAGMQVSGFQPHHVMAHPTVTRFYDRIAEGQKFLDLPVRPVHPLLYIPEFSPLLYSLARIFGPQTPELPVGSAATPPPQGPTSYPDLAPPPPPNFPMFGNLTDSESKAALCRAQGQKALDQFGIDGRGVAQVIPPPAPIASTSGSGIAQARILPPPVEPPAPGVIPAAVPSWKLLLDQAANAFAASGTNLSTSTFITRARQVIEKIIPDEEEEKAGTKLAGAVKCEEDAGAELRVKVEGGEENVQMEEDGEFEESGARTGETSRSESPTPVSDSGSGSGQQKVRRRRKSRAGR